MSLHSPLHDTTLTRETSILTVGYIRSFQILLIEHSRRIKSKKTRDLVTRPNDS